LFISELAIGCWLLAVGYWEMKVKVKSL
jgi:hypothetical protein